jgi:hypothetical protein
VLYRPFVSEASQAALKESGLNSLPKAPMRWQEILQAVLLVLRALCEHNQEQHILRRIICTRPSRNGQMDTETEAMKRLLWRYSALRLVYKTENGTREQFTSVRLRLRLMHEPTDEPA